MLLKKEIRPDSLVKTRDNFLNNSITNQKFFGTALAIAMPELLLTDTQAIDRVSKKKSVKNIYTPVKFLNRVLGKYSKTFQNRNSVAEPRGIL